DLDGQQLRFTVHSAAAGECGVRVMLAGKTVGQASCRLNEPATVGISTVDAWSPDHPTLYDLEFSLPQGDRVTSYFGLRKVEIRKDAAGFNRIFLNNHPLFGIG